jgi:stage II sporulation protein D
LKKLLPLLTFLLMLLLLPTLSKAAELKSYPHEVDVSLYKTSSLTLKSSSAYQLYNNDTGKLTQIPANTTISVKNNGTTIVLSFPGISQTSAKGFKVQELAGTTAIGALSNGFSYRGSFSFVKNGSNVEAINYLDMEDYLRGVVPCEMPASWGDTAMEALKAQAIAARSYAATSMSLTSTPSSQVYGGYSREDSRSNRAVKETEGLMVKFAGKPVMAFFYSSSGGMTANLGDVWNPASAKPYYVSVEDKYDNNTWSETFPAATILSSFGYNSSTTKLLDVSLNATGANGEVSGVSVKTTSGDKTIKGNESKIRSLFPTDKASHYNKIDSNWFTMKITRAVAAIDLFIQTLTGSESITDLKGQTVQTASGVETLQDSVVDIQTTSGVISSSDSISTGEVSSVTLNGRGFGHRIGMSQYGAKGYAEHDWTAAQILQHYFPGTTVSK